MFQGKHLSLLADIAEGRTKLPGLSASDVLFLTAGKKTDSFDSAEQLAKLKLPAIKLLASELFTDRERYIPSLCGCFENSSEVMNAAEFALKRASSADILEDKTFIRKFYELYLGIPEQNQAPVHQAFQKRILILLQKSVASVKEPHGESAKSVVLIGTKDDLQLDVKKEALAFAGWVIRMSDLALVESMRSELWDRLCGIAAANQEQSRLAAEVRKSAISLIGILLIRLPDIWTRLQFTPFTFLMEIYECERQVDIAEDVESTMLVALPKLLEHSLLPGMNRSSFMEGFTKCLQKHMEGSAGQIRDGKHIALRYSHTLLEFSNLTGRLADLVVLQNPEASQRSTEEALRGLDPYQYQMDCNTMMPMELAGIGAELATRFRFPSYEKAVTFLTQELKGRVGATTRTLNGISLRVIPKYMAFLRSLLFMAAIEDNKNVDAIDITENWTTQLNIALSSDEKVRGAVKQYYKDKLSSSPAIGDALGEYFDLALLSVVTKSTTETAELSKFTLEFVSLLPYSLVSALIQRHKQEIFLRDLSLFEQNPSMRHSNAHLFGVIVSYPYFDDQIIGTVLEQFLQSAESTSKGIGKVNDFVYTYTFLSNVIQSQTAGLAHSYLISRLAFQGRLESISKLFPTTLKRSLEDIARQLLEASGTEDVRESLLAFSELCFSGAAGLLDAETLGKILERLISLTTQEHFRLGAIQTIGLFSLLLDETSEQLKKILKKLFSLHDQKDITLQFSIAESLAVTAAGYRCSFLHTRFDIDLPHQLVSSRSETLPYVVSEVLTKAKNPRPSLKKAACVWSLALLEYCGQLPEVKSKLTDFHRVFRSNLSDREGSFDVSFVYLDHVADFV